MFCYQLLSYSKPKRKKWGPLVQQRREVHLSHCQHGAVHIDRWQGDVIAPTTCGTDSSVWGCAEHQEVTNDGTILEPLAARERRPEHHFFCGALTEGHQAPMSTLPVNQCPLVLPGQITESLLELTFKHLQHSSNYWTYNKVVSLAHRLEPVGLC